jgi:hypothetical protein
MDDPGFKASYGWVHRLANRHGLTLRKPTKKVKVIAAVANGPTYDEKMRQVTRGWLDLTRVLIIVDRSFADFVTKLIKKYNYPPENIINMDEIPVWFDQPVAKTVAFKGAKEVKCLKVSGDRERISAVLAVTQAGKMLPVTVITQSQSKQAKEAAGDTLVKHGQVYHYKQANKTMKSHIMCDYVKNVLAPCYPVGQRKLLIMDAAPGHKTKMVKEACKKYHFDIAMIPGGMTGDLQPLDISVNRSFKSKLKDLYVQGLMGERRERPARGQVQKEKVDRLIKSIQEAADQVQDRVIKNGFNHMNGMIEKHS